MSDSFGVLGINSDTAIGTYTSYTVPPSKAARVRFMYRGLAGASSTLAINVNGANLFTTSALTNGNVVYSSTAAAVNTSAVSAQDGTTDAKTCMPYAREYFLSAGDTLTFTIATANFTAMNFQTVGVELDV